MSRKKVFLFILTSRFFYNLFATFIYSNFSQLGDTEQYLEGGYLYRNDFTSPAYILSFIGNSAGSLGAAFISIMLSTLLIYYLYVKLEPYFTINTRLFFFIIILMPSFGIWTSIFSKDLFVFLFFSLSVGFLIDVYLENKQHYFIGGISFLAIFILKPHYSACLFLTFIIIKLKLLGVSPFTLLAAIIISSIIVVIVGFENSEKIFQYTQLLTNSYFVNGASTRVNDFWIEHYDFFLYSPIGIPKAFIGPSLIESLNKLVFFPYFLEGIFLFFSLLYLGFFSIFRKSRINIYHLSLFISFCLLLITTHYPVGILNPGSSIRYRSGFILPLTCFMIFLYSNMRSRLEDA